MDKWQKGLFFPRSNYPFVAVSWAFVEEPDSTAAIGVLKYIVIE